MTSKRKFYQTIIEITVLSEEPYSFDGIGDLNQVYHDVVHGDCSGSARVSQSFCVNGIQMAGLLQKQGSDPDFFRLDENGNDTEELDDETSH